MLTIKVYFTSTLPSETSNASSNRASIPKTIRYDWFSYAQLHSEFKLTLVVSVFPAVSHYRVRNRWLCLCPRHGLISVAPFFKGTSLCFLTSGLALSDSPRVPFLCRVLFSGSQAVVARFPHPFMALEGERDTAGTLHVRSLRSQKAWLGYSWRQQLDVVR